MLDQKCPAAVLEKMDELQRASLEKERQANASRGLFGIFDDMQDCFEGNMKMPPY